MGLIKREPGERRWGIPTEFPLTDSGGVHVMLDRRGGIDRRKSPADSIIADALGRPRTQAVAENCMVNSVATPGCAPSGVHVPFITSGGASAVPTRSLQRNTLAAHQKIQPRVQTLQSPRVGRGGHSGVENAHAGNARPRG